MDMRRALLAAAICAAVACGSPPTEPGATALGDGRWTGDGPCLSVAGQACNLTIGCGHGQFPRPSLRADGSFDIDGTYRIEAGPISIEPAPPARFSGALSGTTLTLTIVPSSGGSLGPYTLRPASSGTCSVPCLAPISGSSAAAGNVRRNREP